jgi:tetratricopeptide (TPR) repeat protein
MKPFTFQIRIVLLLALAMSRPAMADGTTNAENPATAREFYNAGTRLLATNNYAEAERMLQSALSSQDERIQPLALYNLGHMRFAAGRELLKKGPEAQKVTAQGNAALAAGGQAIRTAESALAESALTKMINAYLDGRGARRQLRAAEKAVQAALTTYGNTLRKWQRAADDFNGTAELNPADTNALHNAKLVEQNLAKLVDSMRQMQQMAGKIGDQKKQLDKQLSQLKGQIPAANAPPGDQGDEDEDEGAQPDSLKGKTENAGREGEQLQVPLSPDQAGQILDGISLDGSRRLPMGDKEGAKPKGKAGRTW